MWGNMPAKHREDLREMTGEELIGGNLMSLLKYRVRVESLFLHFMTKSYGTTHRGVQGGTGGLRFRWEFPVSSSPRTPAAWNFSFVKEISGHERSVQEFVVVNRLFTFP